MSALGLSLTLPFKLHKIGGGGKVAAAPVITSLGPFFIPENTTAVTTMTATGPGPYVWGIFPGTDSALLQIDSSTGALSFIAPPNFEAPGDTNGDNIYGLIVTCTGPGGSDARGIVVAVTDVVEYSYSSAVLTTDDTNVNGTLSAIGFDSATVNTLGAWSAGSPTLMTVPTGVTYVRLYGQLCGTNVSSGSYLEGHFRKAGSVFLGAAAHVATQGVSTSPRISLATGPIPVVAGDTFTLNWTTPDASWTLEGDQTFATKFTMEVVLSTGLKAALVNLTSNDTLVNSTNTVTWDAATFDTASYWSAGSPTRLTVPSGVTRVALVGTASMGAVAGDSGIRIKKNGLLDSAYAGQATSPPGAAPILSCSTGPCIVTAGDYFEMDTVTADASYSRFADLTTLSIREVVLGGTRVKMSADLTGVNHAAGVTLTFDTEVFDDLAAHDNSFNPSRLTVPSGVSVVNVGATVARTLASSGNTHALRIEHYNSGAALLAIVANTLQGCGGTTDDISTCSGPVAVSTSDYFILVATCGDTSTNVESDTTTFWIEKVA